MISIKMMMEVSEITNNRLGSLQEMAYYFTRERSLIIVIGT